MDGIVRIAADAARLIRARGEQAAAKGMNLRYEYSPEFSATETDFAVEVCRRVLEELGATPERRVILNLPSTVENCTPNLFADQIEYFCRNLPVRDAPSSASIRTTTAAPAWPLPNGADGWRGAVEGTLFGNGERTATWTS
jgi:2-isopropylmalate synthase